MSQHTSPPRHAVAETEALPRGRAGLVALELALQLATAVAQIAIPRVQALRPQAELGLLSRRRKMSWKDLVADKLNALLVELSASLLGVREVDPS